MYSRVLVALDGSPLAERALGPAERLVAPGGKLTLVQVVAPGAVGASVQAAYVADPYAAQQLARLIRETVDRPRLIAQAYLERVASSVRRRDIAVETLVLEGDAADRLVEAAKAADLVVMTTHGRTGLARALLGSVTEQVVRRSPGPVLVLH